jgi:DNA-directed RNA polymerase subunit beta'
MRSTRVITLHTKIKGRFKPSTKKATRGQPDYETTPGRMLLGDLLPRNAKVPFDWCNR